MMPKKKYSGWYKEPFSAKCKPFALVSIEELARLLNREPLTVQRMVNKNKTRGELFFPERKMKKGKIERVMVKINEIK